MSKDRERTYKVQALTFHSAGYAAGLCSFQTPGGDWVTIVPETEVWWDDYPLWAPGYPAMDAEKRLEAARHLMAKFVTAKFVEATVTFAHEYDRVLKVEFRSTEKP
jgi:hypothetical protein